MTLSRFALRVWNALLGVAVVATLSGCSESTQIHTQPADAFVYVNGRMLGKAPVELSVRSWSVRRHAYRLRVEKAGYLTKETYLEPHFSVGRLISAVASSCLTCSFHGFFEFDEDTEIVLDVEPPPPDFDPVADRLQRLQALYDQGLISAEELQVARAAVLRGVVINPGTVGARGVED